MLEIFSKFNNGSAAVKMGIKEILFLSQSFVNALWNKDADNYTFYFLGTIIFSLQIDTIFTTLQFWSNKVLMVQTVLELPKI